MEEAAFSGDPGRDNAKEVIAMICVGIDAASSKHDVCIYDSSEGKVLARMRIKNTQADYASLERAIERARGNENADVRIGVESTGAYSGAIVDYFARNGNATVVHINPLLTSMYQKCTRVHYAKTDRIDAEGIAKFLCSGARIREYTPPSYTQRKCREIYRAIVHADEEIGRFSCRIKSLLALNFPEFSAIFPRVRERLPLFILSRYDMLSLSRKDPEVLAREAAKALGLAKRPIKKCAAAVDAAKSSVCLPEAYDFVPIKASAKLLLASVECKSEMLDEGRKVVESEAPNLLSIPGIGVISVLGFVGEIGAASNFAGVDELMSFMGMDPIVYESGKYKAEQTRISKKGSPYLRNAFYVASGIARIYCPKLKRKYDAKRAEGKRHRSALGHVCKNLASMVLRLMKTGEFYRE